MKRLICIALAAASLGGCVVLPAGPAYRDHHPRYVEAPVVVVPGNRGYGPAPRPGYGWDRGRDWDRRW